MANDRVEQALAGEVAYDDLSGSEQTAVRVAWRSQVKTRIAGLDLTDELRRSGLPWSEADTDGNVVIRGDGPMKPPAP
jgi:hypothetical protein